MNNLSQLFAAELSKKSEISDSSENTDEDKMSGQRMMLKSAHVVQSPQIVLQLNSIPTAIDIDMFKNPHSSDNPTGDFKAAYRISALANAIPNLAPSFNISSNLVSDIWENLISSAESDALYTKNVLNRAKEKFSFSAMSGMAGIPDNWYPVYTNPSNWYDIILNDSNLIEMELDLIGGETGNDSFVVMDQNTPLIWKVNNQQIEVNINPDTTLKKIYLRLLKVDFIRPWFEFELFNLNNWKIDGLSQGYYSNGNLSLNNGVFPLIIQSMLIGSQISVEGEFSENEINKLQKHTLAGSTISVGSFILNNKGNIAILDLKDGQITMTSNIKQIVGYLSRLVPLSPSLF
jgi:hypothetical protein